MGCIYQKNKANWLKNQAETGVFSSHVPWQLQQKANMAVAKILHKRARQYSPVAKLFLQPKVQCSIAQYYTREYIDGFITIQAYVPNKTHNLPNEKSFPNGMCPTDVTKSDSRHRGHEVHPSRP
jgi:hypothetical protein